MNLTLPLARYRFTFRMRDPLRLPEYAGSLLRGQFGAALRGLACMTGAPACTGCPLQSTCPYPAIFETPAPETHAMQRFSHVPNPYVIEPPPFGTRVIDRGEPLQFCIVLAGRALEQLPLIALALQRAVEGGLERARARGKLETIEWHSTADGGDTFVPIWQHGATRFASHDAIVTLPSDTPEDTVTLALITPMRLQHQGHPVRPEALTPRKFVADLLRRISLVYEFHGDAPGLVGDAGRLVREADSLADQRTLRWQDWSRYSSRQHRKMTLGGATGEWTFRGDLAGLYRWIWLGQWLHIGKNATFGMGGYRIVSGSS